eukprot:2075532-Pyramimonas_sp.AAC.1
MAMTRSVLTGCRALVASASIAPNASQRAPMRVASRGVRHFSGNAFRMGERAAQFKQSFSSTLNEKRRKVAAGASGKVVRGASAVVLCTVRGLFTIQGRGFGEGLRVAECRQPIDNDHDKSTAAVKEQ